MHEPKGVSTAAVGQVYVANGSGSGTWKYHANGWGNYVDSGSGAQVFGTTANKLQCDGAAAASNSDYLPYAIRGTGEIWDVVDDKITPIALGDSYELRLSLPVTAKTGTPGTATLQLDIGGGATPTDVILTKELVVNKTPPFTLSTDFTFYSLNTFLTNGGQIFLNTPSGDITVTNPSIFVTRISAGDF